MNKQPSVVRGTTVDADDLLRRAQQMTGLSDFGDRWFERPFREVIGFINAEAGLLFAEVAPIQNLLGYLTDRLRLVAYLKRHPAVHDEKLEVAGIIIGLPRGGSTLLQRLLTTSPQLTSTYFWESITPLPLAGEERGKPAQRKKIGYEAAAAMAAAWPNMKSMHPIGAEAYEEETALLAHGFISMMYISLFHLPSYVSWQFRQNHSKAYAELKTWLQVLQYNDPSRRGRKWLLKTSCHLLAGGLGAALSTFPDAKAILSHRSIDRVIASWCSLQYEMIKAFAHPFDRAALGPEAVELFTNGFETLLRIRKEHPERFIDVEYADLVADPLAQFRRLLRAMGLVVGPPDERAAMAWIANNGRDTHPSHRYRLEDYGVTGEAATEALRFYLDTRQPATNTHTG